uniref:Crystaline entomocidal protoxin n=1 Tax=Bacillus thuringiensis TaxID=1428 RepID=S5WCJ1_BACTU|nr:Cry21b [Bacillus thuringiensis]
MANLCDLLPSYANVLASPPTILSTDNPNAWDKYTTWRKNVNSMWKEYDQNFFPDGLTKIFNDMYDAYQGDPGSYLALAQDVIRFAFIFIPIPFSSTISFGINKILGLVFPTAKRPSLFEQIKDQVEQLIDQKLVTQEINKNVTALNSINANLAKFSNSIQQAFGKPQTFPVVYGPTNPSPSVLESESGCTYQFPSILDTYYDCTQDPACQACSDNPNRNIQTDPPCDPPCQCRIKAVQDAYLQAVTYISGVLSQMKTSLKSVITTEHMQSYLQIFLPLYTIGVTLLLGLHHSYIQFATKYNFEMGPNGNTNRYMHELNADISSYTDYIYGLFVEYLPPLSKDTNTIAQYNAYIKYTRNITINSLDMVASWSFMDPFNYVLPTNHTFTRLVAHDIVPSYNISNCNPDPNSYSLINLNQQPILNWNTDLPYFYNNTQLNSLQFKSYNNDAKNDNNCYPTGFISSYRVESQPPIKNEYGPVTNAPHISVNSNVYDKDPLFNVLNTRTVGVSGGHWTALYDINGNIPYDQLGNFIAGCYNGGGIKPCNSFNYANPDQRIQAIYPLYNTNNKTVNTSAYLTTLIPTDTTTKPIFTSYGINTFPAQQTINTNGILLPEYINGTASLQLNPGNSAQYIIDNSPVVMEPEDFQIRVRMATTASGQLTISVNNTAKTLNIPPTNINYNADTLQVVGKQGTYMLSNTTDPISLSTNNSMLMQITNTSSTPIILDRIEFIPTIPPNGFRDPIDIHQDIPPLSSLSIWKATGTKVGTNVQLTLANNTYQDVVTIAFLKNGTQIDSVSYSNNQYAFIKSIPQGFDEILLQPNYANTSHFDITGAVTGSTNLTPTTTTTPTKIPTPIIIPNTITNPSDSRTLWNSTTSPLPNTVTVSGSITNSGSITVQFLQNGTVVKEFPFIGDGPDYNYSLGQMNDKQYPFNNPNVYIPTGFDTIYLKINSQPTITAFHRTANNQYSLTIN